MQRAGLALQTNLLDVTQQLRRGVDQDLKPVKRSRCVLVTLHRSPLVPVIAIRSDSYSFGLLKQC